MPRPHCASAECFFSYGRLDLAFPFEPSVPPRDLLVCVASRCETPRNPSAVFLVGTASPCARRAVDTAAFATVLRGSSRTALERGFPTRIVFANRGATRVSTGTSGPGFVEARGHRSHSGRPFHATPVTHGFGRACNHFQGDTFDSPLLPSAASSHPLLPSDDFALARQGKEERYCLKADEEDGGRGAPETRKIFLGSFLASQYRRSGERCERNRGF